MTQHADRSHDEERVQRVLVDVAADTALPGAALLESEDAFTRYVGALAQREVCGGSAEVIRHVPGKRCIVAVGLGTRRLIAKLYAEGEGEPVYDLMAELWRTGFAESAYTVPRPVAFDPLRQVMLLEWVGGQSMAQLLRAGADPLPLMDHAGA